MSGEIVLDGRSQTNGFFWSESAEDHAVDGAKNGGDNLFLLSVRFFLKSALQCGKDSVDGNVTGLVMGEPIRVYTGAMGKFHTPVEMQGNAIDLNC